MNMRPNIDTTLIVALAPLLAAQTVWIRRRALQLPEPVGPRQGRIGSGRPLRLLVIGDSSAAGVGVDTQDQALTPQLAGHLSDSFDVSWHLSARNGATTADAPAMLSHVIGQEFDLAYVIFGVNDAKNLRPESAWRSDLSTIASRLRDDHGDPLVVFSGLPRVQDFPLLPEPMRSILALRAARFDAALKEVADAHPRSAHLPIDTPLDPDGMAVDGFHPGAPIYSLWADIAAQSLRKLI